MSVIKTDPLYEQEIPALLLHHIPPVDVSTFRRGVALAGLVPYFLKQTYHPAKAPKFCMLPELGDPVGKHVAERRRGGAPRSRDQERPHQRPIKPLRSRRDVREDVGKAGDQVDHRRISLRCVRDQAAEIDARGDPEDRRHVPRELLGADHPRGRINLGQTLQGLLREVQALSQCFDMRAQLHVVHAPVRLQAVQASDLGDQVHDPVVASHQLAQAGR